MNPITGLGSDPEADPLGWARALLDDADLCSGRLELLGASGDTATFSHPGGTAWLEAKPITDRIMIRLESEGVVRTASFRDRNPMARISDPVREAELLLSRLTAASGSTLTIMDGDRSAYGCRLIHAGWNPEQEVSSLLTVALSPSGRTGIDIAMGGAGQDPGLSIETRDMCGLPCVDDVLMDIIAGRGRFDMVLGRSLDGGGEWILDISPARRRAWVEPLDPLDELRAHKEVDALVAAGGLRRSDEAP
jgi:hypothetical protein